MPLFVRELMLPDVAVLDPQTLALLTLDVLLLVGALGYQAMHKPEDRIEDN